MDQASSKFAIARYAKRLTINSDNSNCVTEVFGSANELTSLERFTSNENTVEIIGLFLEDSFDMLSKSVQAFNDRVAASSELQTKLRAITSPMDFLALAKAEGFELSGQDFQTMVQEAYQQWIAQLDPKMSGFFSQVRNEKALDNQLKACQSSTDAIALAQRCGIKLSEDDLQQAGMVAETIPGFSFEKLWFRGLSLLR